MTGSPAAKAKKSDGWKKEFENGFSEELMEKLNLSAMLDDTKDELVESTNVSSEFVNYHNYQWREGIDGMARLTNPVATAFDVECDDTVTLF